MSFACTDDEVAVTLPEVAGILVENGDGSKTTANSIKAFVGIVESGVTFPSPTIGLKVVDKVGKLISKKPEGSTAGSV